MYKLKNIILIISTVFVLFLSGCAQVPLAPPAEDTEAKQFQPVRNKSVIYLYRNEYMGAAVSMEVTLDGKFKGKTGAQTYFKWVVNPGKHTITSEAENTDTLTLKTVKNKIYCIWQEVKMGLLYARNSIQQVGSAECKKGVMESKLIAKNAATIQKQ